MYRTPTHELRYKQRARDRASRYKARRYEEQKVSSEATSSEEDEESTDRYTEESEDTTESQPGQGDCEWNPASGSFERSNVFNNRGTRPEDFLMRAYMANERVQKHDKITQKNFLSPFPSFLIPPIYRGGAPLQNYRYPTTSNPGENEDTIKYDKPPRGSAKKSDNYEEENDYPRFSSRNPKSCDKHKAQKEMKYFTKSLRPERVLTCTQGKGPADSSSLLSRNAFAGESSSRNPQEDGRKPKGGYRESKPEKLSPKCKDCLQCMENRKKERRSTVTGANQTEKETKESLSREASPRGVLGSIGSGKVREKLVYVVEEEEGKNLTKLETDLFSVNEILTIKKDLLELSEFAKKLKKLKEMKKDAEKGQADPSGCHCQPVAEVLKNVNKRIEALEARQEELERGSHKTSRKGDTETDSKKTTDQKTLSDSPPKTRVVRKQSAMMSVPGFPKPEMVISRAEFSNNSEIVNELMDIKNQLHKLEKRRMSRELKPETAPLGEPNIAKKKDHAIAVFSSRTYILTSENYEKAKAQQPAKAEEQVKSYFPISNDSKSKTEQTKENIVNWLKSVSPIRERSENEVAVFLEAEKPEPEISAAKPDSIGSTDVFNGVETQEPPKNRASEAKSEKPAKTSLDAPMKTVSKTRVSLMDTPHLNRPIMKTDGRLFVKKSGNDFASGCISSSKGVKEIVVRRSVSNCSATSPIFTKEPVGRMKKVLRDIPKLLGSHSKSTQELSGSSSGRKDQKTVRNPKMKNLGTPKREKIHKDSNNELVKYRESNVDVLKDFGRGDDPLSSSTFSELIRTINLEKPSDSIDGQDSYRNNMHIYSLATMAKLNLKGFDMKYTDEVAMAREREKERRRREEAMEREASRKEILKPGYSKRNEAGSIKAVNLREKEKIEIVEKEVCECVCCCKKKLKVRSVEKKDLKNQTCSPVDLCVKPKVHRSRSRSSSGSRSRSSSRSRSRSRSSYRSRSKSRSKESRRRKKKCSSEHMMCKKNKNREKRKKERIKDKLCRKISKEIAKRKRSRQLRKCKGRSSEIVCERKSKKKKKREESPKKRRSRRGIFCRHNRPPCDCQAPLETSFCNTESVLSRTCCREDNRSSECLKPTVPICLQPPSKDSLEIYLKRQRCKAQIEKEKLTDDNCPFRNVLKNIRKFYPKFSNFQLGNYSGELSDVKTSKQQQQPQKCSVGDITLRGRSERSPCQSRSRELKGREYNHHHFRHHNIPSHTHCCDDPCQRQTTKPEHLKNCKCVRVYLQTQDCQAWPGVMPHPKPSDKSEKEISSANLIESRKPIKRDFIFPGRLPQSQYVGHCCEKKPKCKKHPHKRHKKKSEHCRCQCKKRQRQKNRCVCDKCGNVHKRKKHRKHAEHREVRRACDHEEIVSDRKTVELKHHPPQLHLPLFSFLRYFCKSKSQPSKTCHTTSRVSHKKTHTKKKPPKEHHHKIHPRKSESCCSKMCEIEERLVNLERAHLHKEVESTPRKKEHNKKKQCSFCEITNSESRECSECKTKKNKKEKCCCCPKNCQNEVQAYYFTNPISNKLIEPRETVETSESLTTKTTTTTTTTTATTATTEDTETSTPSKSLSSPSKEHYKLKDRFSSLQSLLNSFHRCRKSKPQTNNRDNVFCAKETDFVDDCSPMPRGQIVPELKAESSSFLEKIKRFKGKKSKKQKADEDEKVEVEKVHHKSRERKHR